MKQPMVLAWLLGAAALAGPLSAQPPQAAPVGLFQSDADVGTTAHKGRVVFDAVTGRYRVTGGGAHIWGDKDSFHFVWTQRSGDLHISGDIEWIGAGTDLHRKAGLMIRQNLTPGSPYADVMVHGDGLVALQYRDAQDGPTRQIMSNVAGAKRVKLEREGDYVFFSVAGPDGRLHPAGGNYRIAFQAPYFVGLAVSAHDDSLTETAAFANVALEVPNLAYVPDTGYPARVESSLEVMEVGGLQSRRIVRMFDGKIEAPNWTRDGKSLIYNGGGRLWRIPVEGGEPVAIATGPNLKNNNEHGLSPDGTKLM
ncbi:MAG: hypothetical protein JWO25_3291, partial [Alphaproteobacteria bacterium]|nr:hypothetical protein [Alphaproteobacteria bacterium]